MNTSRHSEAAFETVVETHLLRNGYGSVPPEGFDRACALFPEAVLDFIRKTQPADWARIEAYTVKRYQSEKAATGDTWRHEKITLKPVNPDFEPIVFTAASEGGLHVIAELVEVLEPGA